MNNDNPKTANSSGSDVPEKSHTDSEVNIAGSAIRETSSSGPTGGSTGTGITADETGFGERGSLPDTAAPPPPSNND